MDSDDESESITAGGIKVADPMHRAAMDEPLPEAVYDLAKELSMYDLVLDYTEWCQKKSAGYYIKKVLEPLNIVVETTKVVLKEGRKVRQHENKLHYRVLAAPGKDVAGQVTFIVPALAVPDDVFYKWKKNEAG